MRSYLRHGRLAFAKVGGSGCINYKIHNPSKPSREAWVGAKQSERSSSNITKQQKNSWRCFVSRHNNDVAKRKRQMAPQLPGKHFIGKWRRKTPCTPIVMHESCGEAARRHPRHSDTFSYSSTLNSINSIILPWNRDLYLFFLITLIIACNCPICRPSTIVFF